MFGNLAASFRGEQGEVDPQRVDCHDLQGFRRRPEHVGATVPCAQAACCVESWILGVHILGRV